MGSFLLLSFFCSIVFLLCLSFSFLYYPFFLFFHQTHSYYRSVGNQISLSLFLFRVSCLVSICVCVCLVSICVYLCLSVSTCVCVYLCLCLFCVCVRHCYFLSSCCVVLQSVCPSVRPFYPGFSSRTKHVVHACMYACVPPHFRVAFFPLSVPCFEFHFPPRIIFLSCRIQSFLFLFPSLPLVSLLDDDDDDDDCDSQRTLVDSR